MAYTQDMAKRMLDFPSTLWNTLSNSFLCTHLMEKKAFFSPSLLSYAVVMMMVSGQMITPPPRPISIKWSRCEKSKGWLISRSRPDQLRRAICRRGSVPDCDLLMVWRLFAWICLMADFSRGPSAGRGDMGLARTCTLAVQPHLNPSPPFSSPLATLLISPPLNLPSSTLFWRQGSHEQNRTTQGFDIPVVACSHLSSEQSDQHTWEKMQ